MAASSTKHSDLERIKKNIRTSWAYQRENIRRYHEFRKYIFHSSINEQQKTILAALQKPAIEANILPAYIARLMGEFAKHEPSIEVAPSEGAPTNQQLLDTVEGYLRHIIYEANKNSFSSEIYLDSLSGGFSAFKVYPDYASPMTFNKVIRWERAFDPTLVGFDPMARHSHKGDGSYSFEVIPMTVDDFKRQFPDADTGSLTFTRQVNAAGDVEGFNWSYRDNENNNVLLVVDYYEKTYKRRQIVRLADDRVMTVKQYKEMQALWKREGYIEQIPAVIGKPRWTELQTICCYKLNQHEILSYEETDYTGLPHIFVSGFSVTLTKGTANNTYQMTIPYVYHAKGMQDLKNFAMQCLANYLENQIQHKFIIKKEALPQEQDYIEALNNIQQANTVVVNAFNENNPDQPIPDPIREVVNVPAPPEILQAFQVTDPGTQTVLGSFASNLGDNDQRLSGAAVIESATQGNAAAMPYMMGYLAAIKQASNITVDLMPKYINRGQSLPIVGKNGKKQYTSVNGGNGKDGIDLDYESHALHVNIEPGVSFQVQKSQALNQIVALMQASQEFAGFMNSPQGLPILVKNLTIYGADEIQEAVPQFLQAQAQAQQQQQQMQQQAMMQNPQMIRAQVDMQRLELDKQQQQIDLQLGIAKQAVEKEVADAKILEAEAKITQGQIDSAVRLEEAQTSLETHALDSAAKLAEVHAREHKMHLDTHASMLAEHELAHTIKQDKRDNVKESANAKSN